MFQISEEKWETLGSHGLSQHPTIPCCRERCAALLLAPQVWDVHVSFVLNSACSQKQRNNKASHGLLLRHTHILYHGWPHSVIAEESRKVSHLLGITQGKNIVFYV